MVLACRRYGTVDDNQRAEAIIGGGSVPAQVEVTTAEGGGRVATVGAEGAGGGGNVTWSAPPLYARPF